VFCAYADNKFRHGLAVWHCVQSKPWKSWLNFGGQES